VARNNAKKIVTWDGTMKSTFLFRCILLGFIGFLWGCGVQYSFKQAQKLENQGYYVEASLRYDALSKKYPQHILAPEALYRIGRIYQVKLKLYSQAILYYQRIIEKYPKVKPWTALAQNGLLDSPDYYPLSNGSFWIEGDSETGGQNMRTEWNCKEGSNNSFIISRRIFAGRVLFTETKRIYRKEQLELREYSDQSSALYTVLLSYPFFEGRQWKTMRDNHPIIYHILSRNIAVTVKAGTFLNCLKISEENPELSGAYKYYYYAPDVGWILTTTAAAGSVEHRATELLSYKIVPKEKGEE
jgi:hypothetical protein